MEHECLVIEDGIVKGIKKGVDKAGIKEIKIPEGVMEIGYHAFCGCKNFESMEIPASITSIELLPFDGCTSLERVRYGGTLTQWCAMDGGGYFTRLAKSVILTGENGLDLKTLTTLKIPEGIASIGGWAFEGCECLESVEIPAGVTDIGQSAFDGCERLERAIYGGTLAQWCEMYGGGHLASVAKSVTLAGENGLDLKTLTTLKIPEGVTEIGYHAFCGCGNFESMEIPASVTRINDFAFFECEGLKSVDIPKNVTSIGFHAFHGCRALENVEIPEGLANIEPSAFYGCESLKSVDIPASVTSIGSFAFVGCSLGSARYGGTLAQWCAMDGGGYLTEATKSVVLADEGGMDLKKQTALKIPEGVTSIGDHAFYGCESLESVDIPECVERIGFHAFRECKALESVSISASVTSIGGCAFFGCESFASVTYGGTREQWKQIRMVRGAMGGAVVHCADGDIAAE